MALESSLFVGENGLLSFKLMFVESPADLDLYRKQFNTVTMYNNGWITLENFSKRSSRSLGRRSPHK